MPVKTPAKEIPAEADRLLARLAAAAKNPQQRKSTPNENEAHLLDVLLRAGLLAQKGREPPVVTATGRARLARMAFASTHSHIDAYRAQHLDLAQHQLNTPEGRFEVTVNDAESPLAWLARRKGKDGRPLIEPVQFQAGERLRGQFTRGQLTPRVTASWQAPISQGRRGDANRFAQFAEATLSARGQLRKALDAVGPEFSGLLLDVCCFLKRLEEVEHERGWPGRSAKVVLQLALDRLARHYGLASETRGRSSDRLRAWSAANELVEAGE